MLLVITYAFLSAMPLLVATGLVSLSEEYVVKLNDIFLRFGR
jgi:hypothetical protein